MYSASDALDNSVFYDHDFSHLNFVFMYSQVAFRVFDTSTDSVFVEFQQEAPR